MVETANLAIVHIEVSQFNKEVSINEGLDRLDESANDTIDIVTTGGGSIPIDPDDFLDNHHFRLIGTPSGAYTIVFPDGNRSFTVENVSGEIATIDSDTGSVVKPTIADGVNAAFIEHGVEMVLIGSSTSGGINNVVEDLTPELGGNLDCKTFTIFNYEAETNEQVGTTYETVASDSGKIITLDSLSPITITVEESLPKGWHCQIIQISTGQVTIAAGGTGNVRNRSGHTKLYGQFAMATLCVVENSGTAPEVYLTGDTIAT